MFESTIQNYNLYFNVLIDNLEIALGPGPFKCTLHGILLKLQNWFSLEFQQSPNGVPCYQSPPGRIVGAQRYSWLLPALGLHAARAGVPQSAGGERARRTWQLLLEWDCCHQIVINQQTPPKICSFGNFRRGDTHYWHHIKSIQIPLNHQR